VQTDDHEIAQRDQQVDRLHVTVYPSIVLVVCEHPAQESLGKLYIQESFFQKLP